MRMCFILMYSVLNTISEYTYFNISKNITSQTFLLDFKIVKNHQCILNNEELEQKDLAKYSGVYFDKQLLSWSKHIEITNNKLHKGSGILKKLCKYSSYF